jgi:hypothetical protein
MSIDRVDDIAADFAFCDRLNEVQWELAPQEIFQFEFEGFTQCLL